MTRRDNIRARKLIIVTNEVRVELYHQAQYNQRVTIIDLRALTRWRAKGLWMDVLELLGVVPH